jgi:hypothetical protein
MTAIIPQIPDMSDEQLGNLERNATRLSNVGTAKARTHAAEVLTAVQEQIRARAETKQAADEARRRIALDKARAAPRKRAAAAPRKPAAPRTAAAKKRATD